MIKRSEVDEICELGPRPRALRALEFGAQLAVERASRYPERLRLGQLPLSFHEDRIGGAAAFLEVLHGVAAPIRAAGFAGAKRIGEISIGRRSVGEFVIPTRTLNKLRRLAQSPHRGETNQDLAERQLLLTMMDAEPIPRICAAYGYWQATGASEMTIPILETGLQSDNQETFDVAAHSLAKMGRAGARRIRPYVGDEGDDEPNSPAKSATRSMTVLIHGTFAKDAEWYQPNGSFHSYLKEEVYGDIYSDDDFFRWTGRYSDVARQAAARKLVAWCDEHPTDNLRLVAHSHGANVVNLATTMGLQACTLIHLSPPVHSHYLPNRSHISSERFFTIRSRIDLVVFIDGGAFDYRHTAVADLERRRIVAIEGHSESHEQNRWEKKNVPSLVTSVCP